MSYCRWSSMDFGCDIYCYGHVDGGFVIHVAGNKVVGDIPRTPTLTRETVHEYSVAHEEQMDFLRTADREPIGLPYDGDDYHLGTPRETAEKLIELFDIGYNVPMYAIESLLEEDVEDD